MSESVSIETLKRIVKSFNEAARNKFTPHQDTAIDIAFAITWEEHQEIAAILEENRGTWMNLVYEGEQDQVKLEDAVFPGVARRIDIFASAAIKVVGEEVMAELIPEEDCTEEISAAFDAIGSHTFAKLTCPK